MVRFDRDRIGFSVMLLTGRVRAQVQRSGAYCPQDAPRKITVGVVAVPGAAAASCAGALARR